MDILNVTDKVTVDNSIVSYEYHTHQPFGSVSYDNSDEIRITIPEIDNYTLPSESYLYIEGSVLKVGADGSITKDVSKTAKLVNNPAAFMFSDIRYLLNGVQVDSVRNVGITSCMKGYFSYKRNDMVKLENAGWNIEIDESIKDRKGVLTGTSNALDVNGKFGISDIAKDEKVKIVIDRVVWRVPHVSVGLREQLMLTKLAGKNVNIPMPFRSWEIHEYHFYRKLQNNLGPLRRRHSWKSLVL
nr:uncharacterized protein LOC111421255 [Onthophagus taurus]